MSAVYQRATIHDTLTHERGRLSMITSSEDFVQLRAANDPRANNDEAPEDIWMDVVQNWPEYRFWVAHNKTVPLSVLRHLAHDADPKVRWKVATKRKCDQELFLLLAGDEDETVRARVALNPKTPVEVLRLMEADPSSLVRDALKKRLG